MKVIEAISDTNIGGAGVLLVTRLKNSDRSKLHTTVLIPKNSALKERLEAICIPTIEIDGCADRSLDFSAIKKYYSVFRKHRPDLVNCHGCFSARIAAKLCGVPCLIYTRHCAYPPKRWQTTKIGRRFIGKVQHMFCDHIIAVAEAAKQNLVDVGVSPERIEVIINGVEGLRKTDREERNALMRALGFPLDSFVVGICARLEPCKGHIDLLRAAEILLQSFRQYRFLIVGDGSQRKMLEEYCRKQGLSEYVRFVGFCEDVSPYVNLFRVQVNCSVGTETSSLALSEGMSLGIPSVASDFGGNPHMIMNGENGLIYPAAQPRILADKIQRIFSDEILYQRLSDGAYRRYTNEFRAKIMTKKTEDFYLSRLF